MHEIQLNYTYSCFVINEAVSYNFDKSQFSSQLISRSTSLVLGGKYNFFSKAVR